ncbi:MAG TPA: response regulator [Thermoguttaceae bacterium]|nr:response regulator [Thermoguttaceae bacterium]
MNNGQINIVIVEDDPNDVELLMRVFRKQNLVNQIVLLKDGAEALAYFFPDGEDAPRKQNHDPKVVLLDLKLPKVNGIEVLERMKSDARTKHIPVVVLTSSKENRDMKAAYRLGVNSYVTKPIKFEEFARTVADLGMYWLLLNESPAGKHKTT